jgi:hypothetical protein
MIRVKVKVRVRVRIKVRVRIMVRIRVNVRVIRVHLCRILRNLVLSLLHHCFKNIP